MGNIVRIRAVVLGRLLESTLRIIVEPGSGQLDGGAPWDVPLDLFPSELRIPNAELDVVFDRASKKIVAIEPRVKTE